MDGPAKMSIAGILFWIRLSIQKKFLSVYVLLLYQINCELPRKLIYLYQKLNLIAIPKWFHPALAPSLICHSGLD